MARQGYRVWIARLVIAGFVVTLAGGLTIRWFRLQMETPPNIIDQSGGLDAPFPLDREKPGTDAVHELDPVLTLAKSALANHRMHHRDYTAELVKRERIHGKLLPPTRMSLKLMYRQATPEDSVGRPVCVYLKTLEPKAQSGREVIWSQGRNNNKLAAHEGGLLGMIAVEMAPLSKMAMRDNRYPITEIGIEKLLLKLIEKGERDRLLGPAIVKVSEGVLFGELSCSLLEIIHESPTALVDGKEVEYEFYLAQIHMDTERQIPLRYASYLWPKSAGGTPELEEEYFYEKLTLNVGLTEADFDPKNPAYGF